MSYLGPAKTHERLPSYTSDYAVSKPPIAFGIQSVQDYNYSTTKLTWLYTSTVFVHGLYGVALISLSILLLRFEKQEPWTGVIAALMLTLKTIDFRGPLVTSLTVGISVLLAVPGAIANSRRLLKASSVANTISLLATLATGFSIWYTTLVERRTYLALWQSQSLNSTALIQDRFDCCGYFNATSPTFAFSTACPTADAAALKQGCVLPFTTFADLIL